MNEKDKTITFYQDLGISWNKKLIGGVKKLYVSPDFKFVVWNKEKIPLEYVDTYKTEEKYLAAVPILKIKHRFLADNRYLTVYKHYSPYEKFKSEQPKFILDRIEFCNIKFIKMT